MKVIKKEIVRIVLLLTTAFAGTYVWGGFTLEDAQWTGKPTAHAPWYAVAHKDNGYTYAEYNNGTIQPLTVRYCGNNRTSGWEHNHTTGSTSLATVAWTWDHASYYTGYSWISSNTEEAVGTVSD